MLHELRNEALAHGNVPSDTYARLFDQARHADDIRQRMDDSAFGKVLESSGGEQGRNAAASEGGATFDLHGFRD